MSPMRAVDWRTRRDQFVAAIPFLLVSLCHLILGAACGLLILWVTYRWQ